MASNIRFFTTNRWATAAAISANGSAAALPPGATQDLQRTSAWRSLSSSNPLLSVDFGSPQPVNAVALADLVAVTGTLGSLSLHWSDDGLAWTFYTDVPIPANAETHCTAAFGSLIAKRYWLLSFGGIPAVTVQVGHVFLGTYLEPSRNFALPLDLPLVDPSRVIESLDGQRSVIRRTLYTTGTWKFSGISGADRDLLIGMLRALSGPIFVAWNTDLGWGTMLAHHGPAHYPQTFNVNAALVPQYWIEIPFEEAR